MATGLHCICQHIFLSQYQLVYGVAIFPSAPLNLGISLTSLVTLLSSLACRPLNIATTLFYHWPCRNEVDKFCLLVRNNVNPKVVENWDSSNASTFREQKTCRSCRAKTAVQGCSTMKPKPKCQQQFRLGEVNAI